MLQTNYKIYEHENGYTAKLYGKSSLTISFNGKEVMHTGFRTINTETEVMEFLADMPEFMEMLNAHRH